MKSASSTKPQSFKFRLPPTVYAELQARAEENRRSINSELLLRLERSLDSDKKVAA